MSLRPHSVALLSAWILGFTSIGAIAATPDTDPANPPSTSTLQTTTPAPAEYPQSHDVPSGELPAIKISGLRHAKSAIDLTAQHDDIWGRIRNGFSMPNLESELVDRHQQWYQSRPDYLRRVVERSRRYMHHIIEEIERRGMPTELALLPIVESSYNPLAISTARASGLWQFIPSTGKNYKLDQNWWVDERRDIVASTGAALEYLKYIYEMHGDWHLALASYNWGEGAVGRAMAKNKAKGLPTDYSSLKMPKETQNYVPKLQALKNILGDPSLWESLNIPSIPNKPFFSTVDKPADMDVKVAAKLAEMSLDEFRSLNPAHNRPVIKADLPIVLPTEKVDVFLNNYAQNEDPLVTWHTYTFQKTDKLEKLAARVGISVAQLKAVNGVAGTRGRIVPGQTLLLPKRDAQNNEGPLDTFSPPAAPEKVVSCKRVKGGKKVCKTSFVSSAAAKTKSAGKAAQAIPEKTGKAAPPPPSKSAPKRVTASKAAPPKPATGKKTRYTVKAGDTVDSIARQLNVPRSAITKHNRVKAGLKPGQALIIVN